MPERRAITVRGIVQGVGFRPFVHEAAHVRSLTGFVRNETGGVSIEVEGEPSEIRSFLDVLRTDPPELARITSVDVTPVPVRGAATFRIERSRASSRRGASIPPDTAPCRACLRELRDPTDRRHRYPFLNCTRCGPRFTIIGDLPYDRPNTTMVGFEMCPDCRREYRDPSNRRFHAQPTACPACGPELRLERPGRGEAGARDESGLDPLAAAGTALREGDIVAVKGLGGYHLACDARDRESVRRLRRGKGREARPLAIMAPDLEWVRRHCRMDPREEEILTSARRPIVLLLRRDRRVARPSSASPSREAEGRAGVAPEVAPGCRDLGVMLPYTPLHELLLEEVGGPLVMTSGNRSGEPIAYRDDDARERLAAVADLFLTHDRPIRARCDDSVTRVISGGEVPIRRSRGYVPESLPVPDGPGTRLSALAVGGHLKNTFCLTRGRRAFPGPHVGDLGTLEAYEALRDGVSHFARLFDARPQIVAHDLHPDYLSTRFAEELAEEIGARRTGVQHHHAHVAACAAEHGVVEPVIGVAFDGTGYGSDGAVWGGEVLVADLRDFRRAAHLAYVPLPGGEAAVRQPWRMAAAHLLAADGDSEGALLGSATARRLADAVGSDRWRTVTEVARRGVGSPPTSSVGRLFDAVAALVGLRREVDFEAQAAMELETRAADAAATDTGRDPGDAIYPTGVSRDRDATLRWEPAPLIRAVVEDLETGRAPGPVAACFHRTLAAAVVELCRSVREEEGLERVALTGGVFQNALLTEWTVRGLERAGFEVLLHRRVPPNDGGLSYGQAAVALARAAEGARPGAQREEESSGAARSLTTTGASAESTGRESAPCV